MVASELHGDLTAGAKGHHEHSHVPCSASPEAGNLAAGLGRWAPGCKLANLYQVPPVATRSTRGSRAGGHPRHGRDAHIGVQAASQDIYASLLRGWGHHEQALASQELVQCSPRAGVGARPLAQRKLYQGVEEPGPPLGSPLSASATPELRGP